MECPDCGSDRVETAIFDFNWMEVEYEAPVRHCLNCGLNWADSEKEDAEMAAIKAAGYHVTDKGTVYPK